MIYREKATLLDLLLLVLTAGMLGFPETNFSISIHLVVLVGYLILRFRSTPLSPYFFLAPAAVYLALGSSYLFAVPTAGSKVFFNCTTVGLVAFSIALRLSYKIDPNYHSSKLIRRGPVVHLFFWALFLLLLSHSFALAPATHVVGKVLDLAIKPSLMAIILGSIVAMATRSFPGSMVLLLFFSSYAFFVNHFAADTPRLLFFDIFVIFIISAFFAKTSLRNRVLQGSGLILLLFIPLIFVQFFIFFSISSFSNFGGDWKIVKNAIDLMNISRGNPEPFMPIFNNLAIFIPDALWVSDKPINYNASATFISKVLLVDPEYYPWGVGVTLFGAGYLYGGYIGVGLIFFAVGLFIGWISRRVRNPFWVGFLVYFLMRLPLGFFRMDEIFVFGALAPTMIAIYFFSLLAQRRINRCFAAFDDTRPTRAKILRQAKMPVR